jgi:hypothetical protein
MNAKGRIMLTMGLVIAFAVKKARVAATMTE